MKYKYYNASEKMKGLEAVSLLFLQVLTREDIYIKPYLNRDVQQ